jgi:DNA polymerase I
VNFNPIAIDTETEGTRPFQGDRATVVSFADADKAWALPADEALTELERIAASGRPVIMHNSPFDRAVLSTSFGIEFADHRIRDTQVMDWLLREAHPHGLKEIGARMFGADAKAEQKELQALMRGPSLDELTADLYATGKYKTKKAAREAAPQDPRYRKRGWADLTFEELEPYAVKDARLTFDVYQALAKEVQESSPSVVRAVPREHKVAGMMYRLNKAGVRVNQSAAEQALLAAQKQADTLRAQIPCEPDSPAQVQKWLYQDLGLPASRKTPKGAPSTDKLALEQLRWHEDVARLLEYRQVTKKISAYLLPLLDRLSSDGRVHPSFNGHRVVTGRFSCSEPNLMTIPREGTSAEVRALFEPEPGMVFVAADLPNAELRVAASLAGEQLWLDAFRRDDDLHQTMADAMGVDRHIGKTCNFALLYGAGPFKLAETLARGTGKAPNVYGAKQTVARYWEAAPRLRHLMDQLGQQWASDGYLPLWVPGRYRHYQGPFGPEPQHKALNSVVQGSVAELAKEWMLQLEPELAPLGARIVLQVHDSLYVETPAEAAPKVAHLLQRVIDDVNPFDGISFPLDVDVKAGM